MRASPTGRTASSIRRGEGGQKESSAPGRARHKPSNHRAGKAECSATPVCCCAVLLRVLFAQRTAGARRHPVFPVPSWIGGGGVMKQNSGELSRENELACLQFGNASKTVLCPGRSAASPRRCEASSGATVRCRAGAHLAALCRAALGPGSAPQRKSVAARPGHEHNDRGNGIPTIVARSHRFDKKSSVDGCATHLDESTSVGP
jgi:hypothetical protein